MARLKYPLRGRVRNARIVLDNSEQSRFIKQVALVLAKSVHVEPSRFIYAALEYAALHPDEFGIANTLEVTDRSTPKIKHADFLEVPVKRNTVEFVRAGSRSARVSRTKAYNQILSVALKKASVDRQLLERIITTVDPNDPWPNHVRKFK